MSDCIFCAIGNGKISAYKVYEDDLIFGILDHRPINPGHVLLMPKQHTENFIDLDDEIAAHIVKVGNIIGRKIQDVLKPKRVGFVVAGFGVAHAHYHVIPMQNEHDITSAEYALVDKGLLKFDPEKIAIIEKAEQEKIFNLIKIDSN